MAPLIANIKGPSQNSDLQQIRQKCKVHDRVLIVQPAMALQFTLSAVGESCLICVAKKLDGGT